MASRGIHESEVTESSTRMLWDTTLNPFSRRSTVSGVCHAPQGGRCARSPNTSPGCGTTRNRPDSSLTWSPGDPGCVAGPVPPGRGPRTQQQWMAKTWDGPPLLKSPAAQTLLADVAATLARPLAVPGLGLGTCFQALPFQCSIRGFPAEPAVPTAHALLVVAAATPDRLGSGSGFGLATWAQVRPFHRTMMVFWLVPVL